MVDTPALLDIHRDFGWSKSFAFKIFSHCEQTLGNLDTVFLQIIFFFHFIASCLFQDLSALNISFPFAIHDTSWKFHRTKADPMHWLSSTILILDSCELRKTTAGLNFVLLFNLKILFALA